MKNVIAKTIRFYYDFQRLRLFRTSDDFNCFFLHTLQEHFFLYYNSFFYDTFSVKTIKTMKAKLYKLRENTISIKVNQNSIYRF